MIRVATIAALLFVAGCGQKGSEAPAANEQASAPSTPPAAEPVPALEGQWSVAAIDGKEVGADSAMTASFAAGKTVVSSGCLRRAWTYTQKRNIISFAADPGRSANCEGQSPNAVQESAYAVLTQANMVIFGKDGSEASLSGMGGNLTLQRR